MKRISFFLALVLTVMSFGMANAQNALNLDNVVGYHPDHVGTGLGVATGSSATITMEIGATVDAGINTKLTGYSTGFQLYSTDGATWTDFNGAYTGWPTASYDGGVFQNDFGPDTVTFAGFTIFGAGTPAGFAGPAYELSFEIPFSAVGTNICFDSTSNFPPSNAWKWTDASSDVFPTWAGPFCYEIFEITNQAPEITNAPPDIHANHCGSNTYDFDAEDLEGDPYTFEIVSGPGSIDANTGLYTWTPAGFSDVNASINLEVRATGFPGPGGTYTVSLIADNQAPTFNLGCGVTKIGQTGNDLTAQMGAVDNCPADPMEFFIADDGGLGSEVSIDVNTGLVTVNASAAGTYTVIVGVTDTDKESTCEIYFNISAGAPFAVTIEKDEGQTGLGAIGGMFTDVDVTLEAAVKPIGGFNFLFAYDASALSFNKADETASDLYALCGWEYFTYRVGADGNCGGGCPSGIVRVIGIAETNNGPYHPDVTCNIADGSNKLMFSLRFLVSSNATFECMYVPVRFFWTECGDNTMTNVEGTELYVEATVSDFNSDFTLITDFSDPTVGFPTYLGVQNECLNTTPDPNKPDALEWIDFVNGGVDIVCADDIDARGDLNLDELGYTIADAVIFTNYFVYGLAAFADLPAPWGIAAATAASDVNVDGLTLTVADLVYLIRVVVGDETPFPKTAAIEATYSVNNGDVRVDAPMAAAQIIVKGNATPELYANHMDMLYHFDGTNTNIIVYSMEANETFEGTFINAGGEVTYIEMATYDGSPVAAKNVPSDFGLAQNYPNPFNPTTVIEFSLPVKSDVSLNVYNVTGQLVKTFNGTFEAGIHEFEWDASGNASGVYFYRIAAGDFNKTMKMVLLK